jgi:hypothetical protein
MTVRLLVYVSYNVICICVSKKCSNVKMMKEKISLTQTSSLLYLTYLEYFDRRSEDDDDEVVDDDDEVDDGTFC